MENKDNEWSKKRNHALLMLLWATIIAGFVAFSWMHGCGREKATSNPPPVVTNPTPTPTPPLPPECLKVTFDKDLKPLVAKACADCHAPFVDYNQAVQRIDEWVRRIDLSSEDPRRMPKKPRAELSREEKAIFLKWREDGLIKENSDCTPVPGGSTILLKEIEGSLLNDIKKVESSDRPFIRYLIASHKFEGTSFSPKASVDKALNSLVAKERAMTLASYVDQKKSIYRIDIRSFELSRNDWELIEAADRFDFVSNTDDGRTLKLLTATRKPWLHFDNFVDLVNEPRLYYEFLGIPKTQRELVDKLGVDYAQDLRNLDATLMGNNDSLLTTQKNRLVSRHDSLDGFYYQSYDILPAGVDPTKNLYAFPFLKEVGSPRTFRFDASEVLFSLVNGLMGAALYDKNGNRIEVADTNIVVDSESPVPPRPAIAAGISCHRCHANGINPIKDEIRLHVLAHADEFGVDDTERVKSLYKGQASLNAIFKVDNRLFQEALVKLGITPGSKDPINMARDELRLNWNDQKLASFLFLPLEELRTCVNSSDEGRTRIGQILQGGSVTYDEILGVLKFLKRDCRLFDERIN